MELSGRVLYEAWAWEVKPAPAVPDWEALSEQHRRAWEALARAVDRSPPLSSRYYRIQKVAFKPADYGEVRIVDAVGHHRSCAIRRGGNECTC